MPAAVRVIPWPDPVIDVHDRDRTAGVHREEEHRCRIRAARDGEHSRLARCGEVAPGEQSEVSGGRRHRV